MLSNKDYYAPVLDDKELFEETKDKFDASATNQNPQEAASSSDASASNDDAEGILNLHCCPHCIKSKLCSVHAVLYTLQQQHRPGQAQFLSLLSTHMQ